ncbi:MAG: ATP-dependent zinc protease [Prolixibacteraceae bacterium]|nr:ATP-dependent zinc protease [Prolixibacteraceae bacterium]MBN2773830.1 ATP-dependent zinc protease [Prolixibacteraceae bacterium]
MSTKILIGRKDIADFPGLELSGLEVKIDSGAYTSSFHCHNIEIIEKNNEKYIKCNFLDPEHPQYHEKEFLFKEFKLRRIKSSNGLTEERFSIITEIKIFNRIFPVELTLTERSDMKYPVLLGRKFLSKKFVIDTSVQNLSAKGKLITYLK